MAKIRKQASIENGIMEVLKILSEQDKKWNCILKKERGVSKF